MIIANLVPGAKIRYKETAHGRNYGKVRTTTFESYCKSDAQGNLRWAHTKAGVVNLEHILEVVG